MSYAEIPPPDEDRWGLRERIVGRIGPIAPDMGQNGTTSSDSDAGTRFETLFRPRPAAPITRSLVQSIKWRLATLLGAVPKGVNDNWNWTSESLSLWHKAITKARSETAPVIAKAQKLIALAREHFHMRRADLILIPSAIAFFLLPPFTLIQFEPDPNELTLASVLIGSCFLMSALIGPRFGAIAAISACIWLSFRSLPAPSDVDIIPSLTHWMISIVATCAVAGTSFALGALSLRLRHLVQLGRHAAKREADIEAFQSKLKRAHNADSILSYLVAYCRDELNRRAIFLALDESTSPLEHPENIDIAAQLKSAGYARVIVNRKAYLPRAIKSFTSSGFEHFTLETPSGVIALLGLDTSNGKLLSPIDRRYVRLLLVSASYALERITMIEKITALEEAQLDFKTRNTTLLNLIANISNTTHNLDDQALGLKQLLDREPSKPYETSLNFIRRNIAALRNSIALLRDVAS